MAATSANGSILLINGPNLNLLGTREPEKYGFMTLVDVEKSAQEQCAALGFGFEGFQSNHEGAIIDRLHAARTDGTRGIVINAGAYTHTSIAIRDALSGIKLPFVEVHVRIILFLLVLECYSALTTFSVPLADLKRTR